MIVVGLDGADWQLLDRYIADGTMPNLARIMREGQRGSITTEHPTLSPLLWTTMMTGVSPLEHRILDFTRFNPVSRQKEPITSDERAVPALWNMASSKGLGVAVFGLWATYPAEEVSGTLVSDRLFTYQYDAPTPGGAVWPPDAMSAAADTVRNVSARTDVAMLHAYVPSLSTPDLQALVASRDPFAHPVSALRRILIETEVMHELARKSIERDHPELAIVYFQGTDAIGHLFAPFTPPKLAGVSDDDYARYSGVARTYFARIDEILGDYSRLADSERAELVLVSDHGFAWFDGRSPHATTAAGTAARAHREQGIFVHHGARRDVAMPRGIRDVTRYVLTLLGLPDDVHEYTRAYRAQKARVATSPDESLAKLRALGYLGGGESAQAPAGSTSTRTAGSYNNEALLLLEQGRRGEAQQAFERALAVDSQNASALWNLADLLRREPATVDRAIVLLDRAISIDSSQPRWLLTRGRLLLEKQRCREALRDFVRAAESAPDPIAYASQGAAAMCVGDAAAARVAFERSLALDPDQPQIRGALQQLPP